MDRRYRGWQEMVSTSDGDRRGRHRNDLLVVVSEDAVDDLNVFASTTMLEDARMTSASSRAPR